MATSSRSSFSVSDFKARALGVIDTIAKTGKSVVITKRGKPLAKVIPFAGKEENPVPGKLTGTLLYEGDLVSPLGSAMWKAAK